MINWLNDGEMWGAYAAIIGTIILIIQIFLIRQQKGNEDIMELESNYRYILSYLRMHVKLWEKMMKHGSSRNKYYKEYSSEHRIPDSFFQMVKDTVGIAHKSKPRRSADDAKIMSDFMTNAIELASIINTSYAIINACPESEKDETIKGLCGSLHQALFFTELAFNEFGEKIIRIKHRRNSNAFGKVILYVLIGLAVIALLIPFMMFFQNILSSGIRML